MTLSILRYCIFITGMVVLFLFECNVNCQDKPLTIEDKLNTLAGEVPALNQRISISVSNVSIHEFLRSVANSSGLNINVDPAINVMVINNFNDVRVMDVLLFLAKEYNLDLSFIGNIISVYKHPDETPPTVSNILYDSINGTITLNYQGQSLQSAVKEITSLTGKNVILSPGLEGMQVSGYVQDMPFDNAIEKFAFSNNLSLRKSSDDFYILSKTDTGPANISDGRRPRSALSEQGGNGTFVLETTVVSFDSLQIYAQDAPLEILIKEVSDKLGINYFLSTPIPGNTTLNVTGMNYKELLEFVFNGTPYNYFLVDDIYIFGAATNSGVRDYRLIKL